MDERQRQYPLPHRARTYRTAVDRRAAVLRPYRGDRGVVSRVAAAAAAAAASRL
jgi:hypothetical protein